MSDSRGPHRRVPGRLFRLNPTFATAMGEHAHDARWPDLSEAGRVEQLAFIDRWLDEFRAMDALDCR